MFLLLYRKHGKIRWAKHSWFQPYKVFCGNTYFRGTLATSIYYLPIAKYSRENFHGTLKNRENRESLAHRIFSCLRYMGEHCMVWLFNILCV